MVMVRLRRCYVRHDPIEEIEAVSIIDSICLVVEVGSVRQCFVDDC